MLSPSPANPRTYNVCFSVDGRHLFRKLDHGITLSNNDIAWTTDDATTEMPFSDIVAVHLKSTGQSTIVDRCTIHVCRRQRALCRQFGSRRFCRPGAGPDLSRFRTRSARSTCRGLLHRDPLHCGCAAVALPGNARRHHATTRPITSLNSFCHDRVAAPARYERRTQVLRRPEADIANDYLLQCPRLFVTIIGALGAGAAGESANVTQAFQPEGRSAPSNSA